MTRRIPASHLPSDWTSDWTPETPVRVLFGDGGVAYLSIDAAAARIADFTSSRPMQAEAWLRNGETLYSAIGSAYTLVTHK